MVLEELNYEIYACKRCRLWQGAKHGVPGEGPLNARIMLVGQNPGTIEDEVGRPFIGNAGKFLMKVLSKNGLKREEFFITNIVKHKTPKNRMPYKDEIEACLPYLIQQISIIMPKKVLLFGNAARKAPRLPGIEYFEIIHPQSASRFPFMKERFFEQCRQAMK